MIMNTNIVPLSLATDDAAYEAHLASQGKTTDDVVYEAHMAQTSDTPADVSPRPAVAREEVGSTTYSPTPDAPDDGFSLQLQGELDYTQRYRDELAKYKKRSGEVAEFKGDKPSAHDLFMAAMETHNPLASWIVREPLPDMPDKEGYSPFVKDENGSSDIDGYEQYHEAFIDSNSPEITAVIKQRIDREVRNQDTLSKGGWASMVASVGAGLADPINLAVALTTFGTGTITSVAAKTALTGVASVAAQETLLHSSQETRTMEETMFNMAATAVLDGTLGAAVKYMDEGAKAKVFDQTVSDLRHLSAAENTYQITATGNEIVKNMNPLNRIAAVMTKITPLGRTLQSEDQYVRSVVQELAETNIRVEGDYLPTSVESLVKLDYSKHAVSVSSVRDLQSQWVKNTGMDADTFSIELTAAMRRGDRHENELIANAAAILRKDIDDLWERAAQQQIPGTFVKTKGEDGTETITPYKSDTSESYLMRRYDIAMVKQDPEGFKAAWIAGLKDQRERTNAKLIADGEDDSLLMKGVGPLSIHRRGHKEGLWWTDDPDYILRYKDDVVSGDQVADINFGNLRILDSVANEAQVTKMLKDKTDDEITEILREKGYDGMLIEGEEGQNIFRLADTAANLKSKSAKPPEPRAQLLPELHQNQWDDLANDIYEKVIDLHVGDLHFNTAPSGATAFNARVDVKDEFLESFLVKDWESLMEGYVKSVAPRVRLAERFGDDVDNVGEGAYNMVAQINRIKQRYSGKLGPIQKKISAASGKEKRKLQKQADAIQVKMTNEIRDLEIMRDRILNATQEPSMMNPENRGVLSALRTARSWNIVTMLSNVVISSIPDMARTITYSGGDKFIRAFGKSAFTKDLARSNMPADDMARIASAMERTAAYRLQSISEVEDGVTYTRADKYAHAAADKVLTLSGMKHWNSMQKTIVGHLFGDKMARILLDGTDVALLKRMGLTDDMIDSARANAAKWAREEDGMYNLGLDMWNDRQLVEAVEAAAVREADAVVVTPTAGDKPILMTTEVGRTIGQFKSFMISATNKILLPLTQESGARPWVEVMTSVGMGAAVYHMKSMIAGREPSDDPKEVLIEAVENTGLAGYAMELAKIQKAVFGIDPLEKEDQSKFYSRGPWGTILGPSAGTAENIWKTANKNTSPEQRAKAMRKLMPFQNHFLLRNGFDAVEAEAAKAIPDLRNNGANNDSIN